MTDVGSDSLRRMVRRLLIDHGVKKLCSVILENVHEDFLCYSKLMEIQGVDVSMFLKKEVKAKPDVAAAKTDVVSDVKTDVKQSDVSGNVPGNAQLEVPKESTASQSEDARRAAGNVVDVSGGNVIVQPAAAKPETDAKTVVVQVGKKPVNVKKKGAAVPPAVADSGEMSIDNIGTTNPVVQEDGTDETSSQGSKKGDAYKQKQRAEQKQKRDENLAKGIEPKSLLTKENLEDWIGVKGCTYAHVAKKIVGCKEEEVSSLAKVFGIERAKPNVAQKVLIRKKTRGG
jgi:hypothetical protein